MRDIINTPVYEVRVLPISPEGGTPVAQSEGDVAENGENVQQLEVIRTQPEPTTEPAEALPGEVVAEGSEPKRASEKEVPLSRERAFAIYEERTAGRDKLEGEGVYEVILRENGDVHSATRVDSDASAERARAATKQTAPEGVQQERKGQTAPVKSPVESVPAQPQPTGDAVSVGQNQPTVAPGQAQPQQQPKRQR